VNVWDFTSMHELCIWNVGTMTFFMYASFNAMVTYAAMLSSGSR
jgi:hypothetical protein